MMGYRISPLPNRLRLAPRIVITVKIQKLYAKDTIGKILYNCLFYLVGDCYLNKLETLDNRH